MRGLQHQLSQDMPGAEGGVGVGCGCWLCPCPQSYRVRQPHVQRCSEGCKKSNDALLSLSGEGSEFDSSGGQNPLRDDG